MKHLCLNLKRFDVPAAMGGVNRLARGNSWSKTIVSRVRDELEQYRGAARFPMYFPEAPKMSWADAARISASVGSPALSMMSLPWAS